MNFLLILKCRCNPSYQSRPTAAFISLSWQEIDDIVMNYSFLISLRTFIVLYNVFAFMPMHL